MEKLKTNTNERICSNKGQIAFLLNKRMERYFNVLGNSAGD